jgi:hypothetical protein
MLIFLFSKIKTMEKYNIDKDINVVCITAATFPNGVMAAHQAVHAKYPGGNNRRFFGISRPDRTGTIIYKAAAELLPGETADGLETFTIKKGTYLGRYIHNFMSDVQQVGSTFREILGQPGLDPNGYCLEIYEGENDVRCLVGLAE